MQWKDEELGLLIVRVNVRAKRLVFRTKNDAVYISVPPGTTAAEVKQAVEKLRPRLLANRRQLARPLIDLDYRIEAPHFQLSVVLGEDALFMRIRKWALRSLFVLRIRISVMNGFSSGCVLWWKSLCGVMQRRFFRADWRLCPVRPVWLMQE